VVLFLITLTGVGFWRAMIHIRAIAQRQVNLDQCSGAAILELRACVRTMEDSWKRIETARKITLTLLPTPLGPEALTLFQRATTLERGLQLAAQKKWRTQAARWNLMIGLGCRLRRAPKRSPYPDFPYPIVDPSTVLVHPAPGEGPKSFRLSIQVARLETEATLIKGAGHEWAVRWTR
jgi:hypothetical protein